MKCNENNEIFRKIKHRAVKNKIKQYSQLCQSRYKRTNNILSGDFSAIQELHKILDAGLSAIL
jgi:hypothetical protein